MSRPDCIQLLVTAVVVIGAVRLYSAVQTSPLRFHDDFFIALKGDSRSLEKTILKSEEALRIKPGDAEALVFHGAALVVRAMAAYRAGNLESAEKYAEEGRKEMDRAVTQAPDNIGVRAPRALTLLVMTRTMPVARNSDQLLKMGLEDYERVLQSHAHQFGTMSEHQKGELLFGLAEGWARAGNDRKARTYFERLAAELKGSPYAARAQSWFRNQSLSPEHMDCIGCHLK